MSTKAIADPVAGDLCPDCEEGEVYDAHLIQADRVERIKGEAHARDLELSATRVVCCPECWQFWVVVQ